MLRNNEQRGQVGRTSLSTTIKIVPTAVRFSSPVRLVRAWLFHMYKSSPIEVSLPKPVRSVRAVLLRIHKCPPTVVRLSSPARFEGRGVRHCRFHINPKLLKHTLKSNTQSEVLADSSSAAHPHTGSRPRVISFRAVVISLHTVEESIPSCSPICAFDRPIP